MDQPADCQREVLAALFRCFTGQQDPRGLTPQELVELLQYFEKGLPPEQVTSFLQFDVRVRFHPGAKNGEGTHTTPGGPPWPPSSHNMDEDIIPSHLGMIMISPDGYWAAASIPSGSIVRRIPPSPSLLLSTTDLNNDMSWLVDVKQTI
eukprot:9473984-Pyramimonas_sp.AAC.1